MALMFVTYLRFPLLVVYLMWLQMASNICPAVVTDLASNSCNRHRLRQHAVADAGRSFRAPTSNAPAA